MEFPIPLTVGGLATVLIGNDGWSLDAAAGLSDPVEPTLVWLGFMLLGEILLLVASPGAARRGSCVRLHGHHRDRLGDRHQQSPLSYRVLRLADAFGGLLLALLAHVLTDFVRPVSFGR